MDINDKLMEKLARLSALYLSPQEKEEMREYLKETLSHFEKIKQIDSAGAEPLTSPFDPPFAAREDKAEDFAAKDEILEQMPEKQGALLKSPPIV